MSHPKRVKEFNKWARAQVDGALIDRPAYSQKRASKGGKRATTHPRRMRRRKRRTHATKTD